MNLRHVVITSVNRDERKDGGAPIFAACINKIREIQKCCSIEVLIPDFKGNQDALKIVIDARPETLNHNVEKVPRPFQSIEPQDHYEWAKTTLVNTKQMDSEVLTKSGIMVGLGESWDEILEVLYDLASWEVDILTIGQCLQPSRKHLTMDRFYPMEEFAKLRKIALEMGFNWVESAPLIRRSYHADKQVMALSLMW